MKKTLQRYIYEPLPDFKKDKQKIQYRTNKLNEFNRIKAKNPNTYITVTDKGIACEYREGCELY